MGLTDIRPRPDIFSPARFVSSGLQSGDVLQIWYGGPKMIRILDRGGRALRWKNGAASGVPARFFPSAKTRSFAVQIATILIGASHRAVVGQSELGPVRPVGPLLSDLAWASVPRSILGDKVRGVAYVLGAHIESAPVLLPRDRVSFDPGTNTLGVYREDGDGEWRMLDMPLMRRPRNGCGGCAGYLGHFIGRSKLSAMNLADLARVVAEVSDCGWMGAGIPGEYRLTESVPPKQFTLPF